MAREEGDRFSVGSNVDLTGVDPGLIGAVRAASSTLPPGWRAEMVSGERKGDPRFHGKGKALDIQLIDAQGRKLPNYQSAENFRPYEQFAQAVHAAQPADTAPIRWGGYFGGPKGKYGAVDLMHFDTGDVPMGGGSWEGGLTQAQRQLFPGAKSLGLTMNAANAPVAGALAQQEVGPESAGQSTPSAASEGPLDTRQLVYNKLTGAGLQSHQALGALWSLAGESGAGLNPNAYNPKDPGGSVGIGQWLGPRRAALENFAKSWGTAVTDPNTQADFLVDELTNPKAATYQPGVFASMQKAATAADATKVWTSQFERPKVDNSDQRIKNGMAVASLDDKGGFVLGKGAPAATAANTAPAAPRRAAADNRSWWEKLSADPVDAEGKPTGKSSPLGQAAEAFAKVQSRGAQEAAQASQADHSGLGQGPGARNVSPGLQNVAQTYGQTLNSFSTPLTWAHGVRGVPGMPIGGLQGVAATQTPGLSLTSVPAGPGGLGYGIDPDLGYGFG